jgi:hypothetical protein
MKQITTILILLFALTLSAQEYSYTITSEPGDSTFTLDNVTELSTNRFEISRTTGLDTTALQLTQYARIQQAYNQIARKEQEIFALQRQVNALRAGLTSAGIEDYNNYQITSLDSLYAADIARFATTGIVADCYIQAREGLTHVVRLISDNSIVAVIVPLAPNYIRLNLRPGYQVNGTTSVLMFATNTRDFRGIGEGNALYRLRIIR